MNEWKSIRLLMIWQYHLISCSHKYNHDSIEESIASKNNGKNHTHICLDCNSLKMGQK